MANLKVVPPGLKSIQAYLKIADEHEKRDPCITYWCRLYAVQCGLKVNDKAPESTTFLITLMDWLEQIKKSSNSDERITNDVVAQAHVENYALKLFLWADGEDRAGNFNKNVVKAFFTSGFIYDIVNTFGEPSEEVLYHRKYAKWKSTYIHNCLKNGITPVAGPTALEGEDGDEELLNFNNPSSTEVPSNPPAPYPIGGVFGLPGYQEGLNLPIPGSHAPPSTPNGSTQVSSEVPETTSFPADSENTSALSPEDLHQAQKYCKWAGSALQYEDVPTAIDNLQKALRLLTTGKDK